VRAPKASTLIWLSQHLFCRVALAAGSLPAMEREGPFCVGRTGSEDGVCQCRLLCFSAVVGSVGFVLQMGSERLVFSVSC